MNKPLEMKKILLILALFPYWIIGQITLTKSDFSDGGDTVYMSKAQDPQIDFSSTGANYTWDFSSLTSSSQVERIYNDLSNVPLFIDFVYGTFASPQYKATNFASSEAIPVDQISQVLGVTISDVRLYSKNSNNGITSVGYSAVIEGTEIAFKSDTIETRYSLPLNYGDTYSSRGYTKLDMNPIQNAIWIQYIQRNTIVDGWGTITTPYGTFNALRLHHFIEETDSVMMEVLGNPVWLPLDMPDKHLYEWITNNEKEPILRITTNVVLGNEVVTDIEYKDVNLTASIVEEDLNKVILYPNPATDKIILEGLNNEEVTIFNSLGQTIKSVKLEGGTIEISDFEPGMYYLKIQENIYYFVKK